MHHVVLFSQELSQFCGKPLQHATPRNAVCKCPALAANLVLEEMPCCFMLRIQLVSSESYFSTGSGAPVLVNDPLYYRQAPALNPHLLVFEPGLGNTQGACVVAQLPGPHPRRILKPTRRQEGEALVGAGRVPLHGRGHGCGKATGRGAYGTRAPVSGLRGNDFPGQIVICHDTFQTDMSWWSNALAFELRVSILAMF